MTFSSNFTKQNLQIINSYVCPELRSTSKKNIYYFGNSLHVSASRIHLFTLYYSTVYIIDFEDINHT